MAATRAPGRWRGSLVRPAGGGDRRRAGDVIRLVAGTLGGLALLLWAQSSPASDRGLTTWFVEVGTDLPWIGITARVVLIVVIPLVVVAVGLATRSWRLLATAASAAATATVVTVALAPFTHPSASREAELASLGVPSHFPLVQVALPVAVVAVGGAFLARPMRRLLVVCIAVGLGGFVLGAQAMVLDVAASALLGWAAAGLAGLVFGAPVGDPTPEEVADDLAGLGVDVTDVVPDGHPVWGTARYRGRTGSGPVVVDVHGREASDARALQRAWHALADKGGAGGVVVGRREQAEHEALGLTLAERAGVRVPQLLAIGSSPTSDDAYVVAADPGSRPIVDGTGDDLDDAGLAAVWAAVAAFHGAGLAHGALDGESIQLTSDGDAVVLDWHGVQLAAAEADRDRDRAAVLLVTAAVVGVDRAVAAAADAVGVDVLTRILPLCQRGALDRRGRAQVTKAVAADVRTAAAARLGIDPPELAELHRVSASDLVLIGGSLLGFWLLFSELSSIGDLWATLASADWWWIVGVLALAQVSVVCVATALRGAVVQPLALGRVVALEYADQFTGLVGGTVAITATNIRFFQRQGMSAATAVTAGVTSSLAGGAVQAVIIVVSLPFLIHSGRLDLGSAGGGSDSSGGLGSGRLLVVGVLLIALVSGVVALVPRFRHAVVTKVGPSVQSARSSLRELLHRPAKLLTMLGGQAASQLVLAIALGFALRAFGAHLPLLELLVINTFASLIGGLAPVPGGMGAVEAGLIAGFTAFGIDPTTAGAATFAYRLCTAYLPPAWGWPTLAWLRRHELL
ncbi:MAG: lysylphosphatidylglycerol synthase transmembrane domain-containing protein [Acidimicrobiales bacterium]